MPISLSDIALPSFRLALANLSTLLDKAEAHATAHHVALDTLLSARLHPDMFAFTRQIQIAADMMKNGAGRLAGGELPKFADEEKSIADLKARLAKTAAFIDTLKPEAIDAADGKEIILPMGQKQAKMEARAYLLHFVLPNLYFHQATAYGILRHSGVALTKQDFLGAMPTFQMG